MKKYDRFRQATDDAGKMPFKCRITKPIIKKNTHAFSIILRRWKYMFVGGCKYKNINFTKTEFSSHTEVGKLLHLPSEPKNAHC